MSWREPAARAARALSRPRRWREPAARAARALSRPRRWREPAARALSRLLPASVVCFVDTREPAFALTFDDGPHPATTPRLLDVLARHRATATFFLIGERIRGNEPIVARIAAEGHEVANHLMRDEPSVLVPGHRFRRELAETTAMLTPYGDVRWFRPGSGWFTPPMLRVVSEQQLRIVLGTLVAANRGQSSDARIAHDLAAAIRPGSIVVLHEGTHARRGVAATTDEMLTELGRRGLAAVTVSELLALGRRGVSEAGAPPQ
jgi:peptidoglycan/xylan/chitin deacetylase (PgdA/CDA1 family)